MRQMWPHAVGTHKDVENLDVRMIGTRRDAPSPERKYSQGVMQENQIGHKHPSRWCSRVCEPQKVETTLLGALAVAPNQLLSVFAGWRQSPCKRGRNFQLLRQHHHTAPFHHRWP